MTNTETTRPAAVHPFEKAGLGRAPFRCIGSYESKFQACQGAPIQPGTCCDYCSTGIMQVYVIKSADGRKFKVGCDCVAKVARACASTDLDRDMRKVVDAVNKIKRDAANKRTDERIARALAMFDAHRAELETEMVVVASSLKYGDLKKTLAESLAWMFDHAGRAGKLRTAKRIEKLAAERGWS